LYPPLPLPLPLVALLPLYHRFQNPTITQDQQHGLVSRTRATTTKAQDPDVDSLGPMSLSLLVGAVFYMCLSDDWVIICAEGWGLVLIYYFSSAPA
jgi:hypothetical protein